MSKRSYYYRRSKRTYPKQKWQMSVVNADISFAQAVFDSAHYYAKHALICQTPVPLTQAAGGVIAGGNNIVKTGNYKVKGTFNYLATSGLSAIIYIVFVPQGITPDNTNVGNTNLASSLFYSHPEWLLGWTRFNMNEQGNDNFSITSRLKRNLNSGDSIQLGVLLINDTGAGVNFTGAFKATVQYTARAN